MTRHVIGAVAAAIALSTGVAHAAQAAADKKEMSKPKVPSFQFSHEETVTAGTGLAFRSVSRPSTRRPAP